MKGGLTFDRARTNPQPGKVRGIEVGQRNLSIINGYTTIILCVYYSNDENKKKKWQ